jgi:hypothetical protein
MTRKQSGMVMKTSRAALIQRFCLRKLATSSTNFRSSSVAGFIFESPDWYRLLGGDNISQGMILIVRGHINTKADKYDPAQWTMYELALEGLSASGGRG